MKKYIQIIVVLGCFFGLVFLKNHFHEDEGIIGVQKKIPKLESTVPTTIPTEKPSPTPNLPDTTPPIQTGTPTPAAVNTPTPSGAFKDGAYRGTVEDAFYGNLQVKAIISGGKLTDIEFLQYPNDNRTSLRINTQALPILRSEAISAQSAQVDSVTGASDSSPAFVRSLTNALIQAKQ